MRKLLWTAAALLLVGASPSPAPSTTAMADFIRAVLPSAESNFAALLGQKIEWESPDNQVYADYKLRLSQNVCDRCRAFDRYGRGEIAERWSVSNIYTEAAGVDELIQPSDITTSQPEWPVAKTEAYVKSQIGTLLLGFSLKHITIPATRGLGTTYDLPALLWSGPHGVSVLADIYPQMESGFVKTQLTVTHLLPKSTHVLGPPTAKWIGEMQRGAAKIVQRALPVAPNNFIGLQGPIRNEGPLAHDYDVTASFGSAFRPCVIFDSTRGASFDRTKPASVMSCNTYPVIGNRAKLEEPLRAAISKALPSGFTATPIVGNSYYDYLWKSNNTSVAIEGIGYSDVASFEVIVMHFLP